MATLPDWLTIREAAEEILGVSPQRVHQLIKTYGAETRQPSPRLKLVKRTDVVRIADKSRPSGVHLENQTNGSNGSKRKRR